VHISFLLEGGEHRTKLKRSNQAWADGSDGGVASSTSWSVDAHAACHLGSNMLSTLVVFVFVGGIHVNAWSSFEQTNVDTCVHRGH